MTARERMMALAAMLLLFVFGGGLVAYQFFLQPMKTADTRIVKLAGEVADDKLQLKELDDAMPRLDLMKKMSLPADPVVARFTYSEALDKMLRDSEFPAGKFSVTPKDMAVAGPATGAKKPQFQRLTYDVKANGDLSNFVMFLDKFYETPLLHRIRTMKIDRPLASANSQRQNELEFNVSIEALIVDGAENRKTLLPEGIKPPQKKARSSAHYASIAGKDIFYGPPPPAPTSGPREGPTLEVALEDCIHLDGITIEPKGMQASLYDVLNDKRYIIRSDGFGGFEVRQYWYLKAVRKLGDFGKELVITDEKGETVMEYKVVRIDATQIVLESEDTFFTLRVGGTIKQVKELKPAEAKAIGLAVKDKKLQPKDKKEDKKDKKDEAKDEADGK